MRQFVAFTLERWFPNIFEIRIGPLEYMKPKRLALLLFLPVTGVLADTPATLEDVIVTAKRVRPDHLGGIALDAVRMAELRAASNDTASLLRDVPGISLYGAGGVSSLPAMHGLADDRLRIKVDGMDLIAACPNHMNPPLSYIDPSAVAQVRVYAGISPVSVGGDSIGGSIVVESAAAEFAKSGQETLHKGGAGTFYRSNGNARGANLAATLAGAGASLSYSGAYARADNYTAGGNFKNHAFTGRADHGLGLDEVGSSAYESVNQSLKAAWRKENHLLEFMYGHQHIPFENFPNQRMDMTDNVSDQFNLAYTGRLDWGTLKARVHHEHTQHEMDFGEDKRYWYGVAAGGTGVADGSPCSPVGAGCAAGMPMYSEGRNKGLSLGADLFLNARDTLRVGGEYQAYHLDDWWPPAGSGMWPGTFWNIRQGQRDRYALFAEMEARRDAWTHILGLRHETVKMDAGKARGYCDVAPCMGNQLADSAAFNALPHARTDRNWDLGWLARLVPNASRTYEFGMARKTRSPNLYERYTWSTWSMAAVMNNFVGDGNGHVGNPGLKPEVAHSLSLAADWHDADTEKWGLRLATYYTRVQDYIDARRLTSNTKQFNVLQYVNQSARLVGLDLSGHARLAAGTAYGDFMLKGSMGYTRGKNRDTGENLYNIMPLNMRLALVQKQGMWRNTLEAEAVARKDKVSALRNEMETGGYGLMHLRSHYAGRHYSVDFGIENLFDRLYALPLGGTYLGQGTTMSMNPPAGNQPQWGTPVPGPGRTVYAGLNLKF